MQRLQFTRGTLLCSIVEVLVIVTLDWVCSSSLFFDEVTSVDLRSLLILPLCTLHKSFYAKVKIVCMQIEELLGMQLIEFYFGNP